MGNKISKKNQKEKSEVKYVTEQQELRELVPIRAVRDISAKQFIFTYKIVSVGGYSTDTMYAILCLQVPVGPRCGIFHSLENGKLGAISDLSKRTKYRASEVMVVGVQLAGAPEPVAKVQADFLDPAATSPTLHSFHDKNFRYTVGGVARSDKLAESNQGCGHGIHFFVDIESATRYNGSRTFQGFWPVITPNLPYVGEQDGNTEYVGNSGHDGAVVEKQETNVAESSIKKSVVVVEWPIFTDKYHIEEGGFEAVVAKFTTGSVVDFRVPTPIEHDEKTEEIDEFPTSTNLEQPSAQAYIGTNVYEHHDDSDDDVEQCESLLLRAGGEGGGGSELRHRIVHRN